MARLGVGGSRRSQGKWPSHVGQECGSRIQSLDKPVDASQEMALGHPKHRKIKEPVGIKQRNDDKYVPTALSLF